MSNETKTEEHELPPVFEWMEFEGRQRAIHEPLSIMAPWLNIEEQVLWCWRWWTSRSGITRSDFLEMLDKAARCEAAEAARDEARRCQVRGAFGSGDVADVHGDGITHNGRGKVYNDWQCAAVWWGPEEASRLYPDSETWGLHAKGGQA